jgi:hypothetical protein
LPVEGQGNILAAFFFEDARVDSPMNRAFASVAEQLLRAAPAPAPSPEPARSDAGPSELQSLFARLAQQPQTRRAA